MKTWFEYEHGYVNIDEEWIYLNNTGVWSDLGAIEEYNSKKTFSSKHNKIKALIFLYPALLILVFGAIASFYMGVKNVTIGNTKFIFNFVASIIASIGTYFIYKYFKKDLGITTKISRNSITKVHIESNKITIDFWDATKSVSKIEINLPSEKGIEIMSEIYPQK
jgi:hypothetical protein